MEKKERAYKEVSAYPKNLIIDKLKWNINSQKNPKLVDEKRCVASGMVKEQFYLGN